MHTVLASILIIMYYYYMKPVFRLNFIKDLFELNLNNQSIIDDRQDYEYFKQMEKAGILELVQQGKVKSYKNIKFMEILNN